MKLRDHYKLNFHIAAPVMIGQLGHIMVGVADSIMVGQLGTYQLAAVGLGNSVFSIVMVFGLGIAFGITPLVAKADGMNRRHLQGVLLRHAFWVNLLISLLLVGLLLAVAPALHIFGQDPAVLPYAESYLMVLSTSLIPLMTFTTFKQFAEGLADTRTAMVIIVGCNLLNVLLNYLFIFGNWGMPALGVTGAAWASLLARILMAIAMWIYVIGDKKFSAYNLQIRIIHYRQQIVRRLLQVGFPTGLQYIFEVSAFALAAIFAGMLSATALAAHQIAINIASVSYMAVTGMGAAATVRIGNQAGKRDWGNLRRAAGTIFAMAMIWMAFAGIVIFFFRDILAGFYSNDPDVLALAGKMLIVVVIFQLSDGIQAVALGALRGLTDVKIPTYITFVAYWLFTLPMAYALSQFTPLGAMGIWYSLAAGLTVSGLLLVYRFRKLTASFAGL